MDKRERGRGVPGRGGGQRTTERKGEVCRQGGSGKGGRGC